MSAGKIMKIPSAIRSRISLILFLTLIALNLDAQENHPYVKNLKANVVGESLLVSWTTKAGFSCQDIEIQLSTDSMNFSTKAVYYGLCGDFEEKDYSIIVDSPYLNQWNYVRLNLGNFGTSYLIQVFVLNISESRIIPHPVQEQSLLHFVNEQSDEIRIELYNIQGEQVEVLSTRDASYPIGQLGLSSGMYLCRIYRNEQLVDILKLMR